MQIHSLRTFYWVTRLNSFRKAAKVLNISQPTVSSRIRGLEEELGVTLLSRDQNLALTVQGEELLEYARTVLRLTEDLSFHRSADARDSRLRLGANGPVAATWLMPLVERMERKFPDLRVEIEVNQSATLLRHMGSGQLDIAFASSESQDSSLKYIPLGSFDMVWIAAPGLFHGCLSDDDARAFSDHRLQLGLAHTWQHAPTRLWTGASSSLHPKRQPVHDDPHGGRRCRACTGAACRNRTGTEQPPAGGH